MASTENLTPAPVQAECHESCSRSCSISPEEFAASPRPVKRRRTLSSLFFGRSSQAWEGQQPPRHSSPESGDDCDQPLRRRKSSLFNTPFHPFSKSSRKRSTYDKLPEANNVIGQQDEQGLHPEENVLPQCAQEPPRKRHSLAAIKDWFSRRRRDSGYDDNTPANPAIELGNIGPRSAGINCNPHAQDELHYFNSNLEPYATSGLLRFENRSLDVLETFDGPSNYYQAESYQNRQCSVRRRSPYCDRLREASSEWLPEDPPTPTPETNADAGITDDPHRWRRLNGYSPGPVPKEYRSGQNSFIQLTMPNFIKTKKAPKGKQKSCMRQDTTAGDRSRRTSTSGSIFSTTGFSRKPEPFGAPPELRLRNLDELGVLPIIEAPSIENSSGIPVATFSPTSTSRTSSMIPLHAPSSRGSNAHSTLLSAPQHSANSSYRALNPCPPSPAINPSNLAPPPARSPLRLPSPRIRPTTDNLPSMTELAESPAPSVATQRTAADNASSHSDLQLRRMSSSLAIALDSFHIGGYGTMDFQYVRGPMIDDGYRADCGDEEFPPRGRTGLGGDVVH